MQVHIIPILDDNYAYIIQSGGQVSVIDPGEAAPIIKFLEDHNLNLNWVINTHKHWDHVAGNQELIEKYNAKLAAPDEYGPADERLEEDKPFSFGNVTFDILHTPGHTMGHMVLFEPESKTLFSADTLFVMGCGRVFEGSMDDMYQSMQKIKKLPLETTIYCGHEYTLSNAKFAAHALPHNQDIQTRLEEVKEQVCTMPTTLDLELKTNPFLIAQSVEEFTKFRKEKDKY